MKVSTRGLAEIAGHEAIVLTPYKDSKGIWTIGLGHTASAGPPNPETSSPLTLEQALGLFAKDIAKFEERVNRAVRVPIAQHEFDALVSFDFNTGAITRASLVDKLNVGDKAGAAEAFMLWVKPPELYARRSAEMRLFRDGTYGDGMCNVYRSSPSGRVLWDSAQRKNALEILAGRSPAAFPISQPATLREGMNDGRVRILQSNLNRLGAALRVDGDFGGKTKAAVEAFQGAHGLKVVDGVVGPLTAAAIVQALSNLAA